MRQTETHRGAESVPAKRHRKPRRPKWQSAFLAALGQTGSVLRATRACGVGRATAYRLRDADADFAEAWQSALEEAADELEYAARLRALGTAAQPVLYRGRVVSYWVDAAGECLPDPERAGETPAFNYPRLGSPVPSRGRCRRVG